MSLKQQILNEIVRPAERVYYDTVQAEVVRYDELTNKAVVTFHDPRGGGPVEMDNVPVQLGSGGVHSSGPFAGDQVWISFEHRNPLYPRIVALGDKNYRQNSRERYSHERQGAYAVGFESYEIEEVLPLETAWLTPDKDRSYDYYVTSSPILDLEEKVKNLRYYQTAEVGMTHPNNQSTMKIADDGCITLFTGIGEGIRINPADHTITILSSGKTIHKEGDVEQEMSNWSIHCQDEISIYSKGSTTIESEENIIMKAKDFVFRKMEDGEWKTLSSPLAET